MVWHTSDYVHRPLCHKVNDRTTAEFVRTAGMAVVPTIRNMELQPHQQRVLDEKSALDEKHGALGRFVFDSPIFAKLPKDEQGRLRRQLVVMGWYSEVLGERIAAFTS